MATRALTAETVERLVEHMFDQVLNESERGELLDWIHAWEAANPGVDAAHRVTGWIDVAYAFQSRNDSALRQATTTGPLVAPGWMSTRAFA